MELLTNRLLLREFYLTDLDDLFAYSIPPEMRRYEKGVVDRKTAQSFLKWVIRKTAETPRNQYFFAITVPPTDKVIGHISLKSQNPEIREWEIGWAVRIEDWGKGYASESAGRVLEYAFHHLNTHRVVAFCHAENKVSVKVMEKIAMKQEGQLRQTRWFNDCWADEYVYAILESDYVNNRS